MEMTGFLHDTVLSLQRYSPAGGAVYGRRRVLSQHPRRPVKDLFLSPGGLAVAGYETVNWGEQLLFDCLM
jgi:hypothetical protein